MKIAIILGLIVCPAFLGPGVARAQKTTSGHSLAKPKNRPPIIESFISSAASSDLCRWSESATVSECRREVFFTLKVKVTDPDGDPLSYQYSTKEGVISANGPTAYWILAKSGTHNATVQVTDGRGGTASRSVRSVVHVCGVCDGPPCPIVNLSGPDTAVEGDHVVLEARVQGVQSFAEVYELKIAYRWEVTNGTIIKGQGTPSIVVEVANALAEQMVVTIAVKDLPAACPNLVASCRSLILKKSKP